MKNSVALSLLLGFELSYYLLILQTGLAEHYDSNLITLFPMFFGGILGTIIAGLTWRKFDNPIQKIMIALSLQLLLSFLYPNYNIVTLALLGLSVGLMAPLGIYLFKAKQQKEIFFALAIAYTIGTYSFMSEVDSRLWMAVIFSVIALGSAVVLKDYRVEDDSKIVTHSFLSYLPLMLWIFLDSSLFETLSRHAVIDIWSQYTTIIIISHILGLVGAYYYRKEKANQFFTITTLFVVSYALSYLEMPFLLAIIYPFTISYYNVIVFTSLSQEMSLKKLSFIMIFVGWMASGLGLAVALSRILH